MVWRSGSIWCQKKESNQKSTPNELSSSSNFSQGQPPFVLGLDEGQLAILLPPIITISEAVPSLEKEQRNSSSPKHKDRHEGIIKTFTISLMIVWLCYFHKVKILWCLKTNIFFLHTSPNEKENSWKNKFIYPSLFFSPVVIDLLKNLLVYKIQKLLLLALINFRPFNITDCIRMISWSVVFGV